MARYIDADKLIAHLKDEIKACKPKFNGRSNGKSIAYGTELGLKCAISFAETLPTADVAPKSEVAREIEKFEQQVGEIYNRYVFEDTDYADDDVAIEAVINALTDVLNDLADFKKKYTEERE